MLDNDDKADIRCIARESRNSYQRWQMEVNTTEPDKADMSYITDIWRNSDELLIAVRYYEIMTNRTK